MTDREAAERRGEQADAVGDQLAGAGTRSLPARVGRIAMTEEAVYGLILVSGMIVVSHGVGATSIGAFITVLVTVLVFYVAHVYAGSLARMALSNGRMGWRNSIRDAAHHSEGMLVVSIVPLAILALGTARVLDDDAAIWAALIADTVILGLLGWFAVTRWTSNVWLRLGSALVTSAFGGAITLLKAFIHH